MADKQSFTLDIPAVCTLAVAAKGYKDEVTGYLDEIRKRLSELENMEGLEGGQGEQIMASLKSVKTICDQIALMTNQIYIVADKKANAMSEEYRDHGGSDAYSAVKKEQEKTVSKK